MSYTVNGQEFDYNSNKNQRIKEKFVGREVYCLVNSMVEYILGKSYEESNTPFSYDDVTNYYSPVCSECGSSYGFTELDNAVKCTSCDELFMENQNICTACEEEENDFEELEIAYKCCDCGKIFESTDDLETSPREIFQWFMVSDFLARKLQEKDECVIEGEDIWGRGTFGQAILLDHVISEICFDMEILEGQKYEWSVN